VFGRTGPQNLGGRNFGPRNSDLNDCDVKIMAQTQILILQPDAFWNHTMQQNETAAGPPPDVLAGFKGAASWREGREGKGKEGMEGKRREGKERRGTWREGQQKGVEQGRRLAKAGPERGRQMRVHGVVENGDFRFFRSLYLPNLHIQGHNYYIVLCSPLVALQ